MHWKTWVGDYPWIRWLCFFWWCSLEVHFGTSGDVVNNKPTVKIWWVCVCVINIHFCSCHGNHVPRTTTCCDYYMCTSIPTTFTNESTKVHTLSAILVLWACTKYYALQGVGLASLAPTPFIRKGSQPSGTWDLEHSIKHAHLWHPVGAHCWINQLSNKLVSSLSVSLVRLVKARSRH